MVVMPTPACTSADVVSGVGAGAAAAVVAGGDACMRMVVVSGAVDEEDAAWVTVQSPLKL